MQQVLAFHMPPSGLFFKEKPELMMAYVKSKLVA
jgi:hypothetical protein